MPASTTTTNQRVVSHQRHFQIAGMTVQVESDLPFAETTFHPKLASFAADGPGDDTVVLRHHFELPERDGSESGQEVYRKPPWAIYRLRDRDGGGSWVYHSIAPHSDVPYSVAVFDDDHTHGDLYSGALREKMWRDGGLTSLTMYPTDQVLVARLIADRQGCLLHCAGLIVDGQGLAFVGRSEAGKSTTALMVREALGTRAQILCDDRNIVRRWPQGYAGGRPGFYVHGTWSHGDVAEVSSAGAPLRAVLFLEQSPRNELAPLTDRGEIWRRLLATLIRPALSAGWWVKEMDVLKQIAAEVPCFTMRFDKSGAIAPEIERLAR